MSEDNFSKKDKIKQINSVNVLHIRCGTISRSTDETRKKRRGLGKIKKGELLNRRGGVSLQNQGVGTLCQLYFTKNIFISAIN